jgi:hypothetical protein
MISPIRDETDHQHRQDCRERTEPDEGLFPARPSLAPAMPKPPISRKLYSQARFQVGENAVFMITTKRLKSLCDFLYSVAQGGPLVEPGISDS